MRPRGPDRSPRQDRAIRNGRMNIRRRNLMRIHRDAVPLLSVQDLSLEFRTRSGTVHALENVGLEVRKGETIGIVGESGSGKSVLSYAILRILDPAARITRGSVAFGGLDILAADEATLQEIRGREAAMIFQSPRTALNP